MNVIITGSSGFVGRNLISYFSDFGIEYLSLSREDLIGLSYADIDGYDAIIHLAGKAHDLKNTSNPEEYFFVNYELTKKTYDEFLKSKIKVFIFISSIKALVDSSNEILTENMVPNPGTVYGKSKLMAENYIRNQPLPDGKTYYILRPCMIHGPGNKGNLNLLYQLVNRGIPYPLAAFENRRSFLSVENFSFVIKELLYSKIPAGIYNVSDNAPLSTNKVIELLGRGSHRKAILWKVPTKLISLLAKVGDKIKLPLNSERLNKLTDDFVISNEKIIVSLGKELPLSSMEGILRTAEYFAMNKK